MTLESFEGSPQYVSPMMQKPGKVALRLAPRLQGEPASGGQRPLMPAIDMPGCIGPPPGLDCGGPGGPCTSVLQPGALWTSMLSLSMLRGNHPKCPSLPFNFAAEYLSRANSQDTGKDSPSPSTSSGDAPSEWNWPQGTTSVMIRNIPNRYTTEELLEELVAKGFAGDFDFFYLPIDFETKRNKGYCFLNLHTQELARRFRQAFVSQKLERYKTMKVLQITPADTQGFDANVLKYLQQQSNRIHNPWFKPMIFLPSCVEGQPWNCLPLSLETLPARLRGQAKLSRRRKVEERADVAKLGR